MAMKLYNDVLVNILEHYREDYAQLYCISLVNKEFNQAASNKLYYRVVLSPPTSLLHQLNLMDTGAITTPSNLPSAILPRYAPLVAELEVSGYLSPRGPARNTLHTILSDALRKFTSIRSVKFFPATFHEDVFINSLKLLPNFENSLRELELNSSCTSDEAKVSLLTDIKGLSKLALYSPGRAVLQPLPDWLKKNADTLTELHLLDNCGSVTPGVLNSFLPHVQETLRAFSLGLSYSITDEDIFTFLSHLPNLEHLRLRNYWQMKPPTHKPGLPKLKSFTADYGGSSFTTCHEVSRFCKWIRRTIAASPIQTLRIVAEGVGDDDGEHYVAPAYPAFDSLMEHLAKKHATTLRHLCIKPAFVSLDAFKSLLESCSRLESFHMSAGKNAIARLSELLPNRCPNLHTAAFEIRHVKRRFKVGVEEVVKLMQRGHRLRRLIANGTRWEGSWKTCLPSGETKFVIEEIVMPIPPWKKNKNR